MSDSFSQFSLLDSLKKTLSEKGLKKPTEIQKKAIPVLLGDQSFVGVAETGSGKTLSYALPLLHKVKVFDLEKKERRGPGRPKALVVVPTRELGEQVAKVFKIFTHETRLRVRGALGGTSIQVSKENVSQEFEVLVSTPGRLMLLLEQFKVDLSEVDFLVFDEADQMLDPGFLEDAKHIVQACQDGCQIGLFSATLSKEVEKLIASIVSEVEVFKTKGSHRVVSQLKTENMTVVNGKRFALLESLLSKKTSGGTVIFTNTREQCDNLAKQMEKAHLPCVIYRGEMDKVIRRRNLNDFREGKVQYLISTDLASRGLDVEHVGRVINYNMPSHLENYLHRVGRTARAGREGLVINFITERDQEILKLVQGAKALRPKLT
ncbi:DEAD/DEAH box helicase [bacterium]|nr:DEAD/DEAH box helicase [bacterium]